LTSGNEISCFPYLLAVELSWLKHESFWCVEEVSGSDCGWDYICPDLLFFLVTPCRCQDISSN